MTDSDTTQPSAATASTATNSATTDSPSLLRVEDAAGVRTITINRPDAFNSLNRQLRLELLEAFRQTAAESTAPGSPVRAVVLRAAGKAFCSGQDLREQLEDTQRGTGTRKVVEEYNPMIAALLDIPVPTVALVQGPAAGAGWGIAMACDFRILSDAASFKGAFTGVGLAADSGLSQTLVDAVGRATALQLLLSDRKISAERALQLGLAMEVVPASELESAGRKFAEGFAQGPTAAFKEMKSLVKRASEVNSAADAEAEAQLRLFRTADHVEAVDAFLAKRAPRFEGR